VGDDLDDLLRRAGDASDRDRIEYRDAIADHGSEAVRRLQPWLHDPWRPRATFAALTIGAAASRGALYEARTALRRARPGADPIVQSDIDRALATLGAPVRAPNTRAAQGPSGSPERALEGLRILIREWRDRACPSQRAVEWDRAGWVDAFGEDPFRPHGERLRRVPASLDRADVRRIAAEAIRGPAEAEFAFLVVKAWGDAGNGYGWFRARESLERTSEPGRRLLGATRALRDRGPFAAYERLADGGESRVFGLGPAFGTKYLYFCQPEGQRPRALIHDAVLAGWLREHAGLALGSEKWSLPRYRGYLSQMHSWAERLDCEPDDVELCIFQSAVGDAGPWKEA
jgi:hypothetical protein